MTERPIARLPDDRPEDEWCDACSDDNIAVVIEADKGNQVAFCSLCAGRMTQELHEILRGILVDDLPDD